MNKWEKPKDAKPGASPGAKDGIDPKAGTEVVSWKIDQWYPELSEDTRKKLKQFHDELIKFNKAVNLVSAKTIPKADAIHFADSIIACRAICASTTITEMYDFGSGNGFPGLVFAILNPTIKTTLVDLDQRKAEFIKHTASILGLKNTEVLIRAVEQIPQGSVKFAISRGFASIPKALLSTRKLFSTGGKYYHMKGEEWASELASIPTQLCSFWMPSLVTEYKLPGIEVKYAIVKTEKIAD